MIQEKQSPVSQNTLSQTELEDRFREYLRRSGKKVTEERLLILRTIYSSDKHQTARDLCREVENLHTRVSRATMYRTLEILVEADLVTKLALEGHEARFEPSHIGDHHDHIICKECFKILEFFDPKLEAIQNGILKEKGFKAIRHVHHIFAECLDPNCPGKKNGPS